MTAVRRLDGAESFGGGGDEVDEDDKEDELCDFEGGLGACGS